MQVIRTSTGVGKASFIACVYIVVCPNSQNSCYASRIDDVIRRFLEEKFVRPSIDQRTRVLTF
jgi:hypothetical protein